MPCPPRIHTLSSLQVQPEQHSRLGKRQKSQREDLLLLRPVWACACARGGWSLRLKASKTQDEAPKTLLQAASAKRHT